MRYVTVLLHYKLMLIETAYSYLVRTPDAVQGFGLIAVDEMDEPLVVRHVSEVSLFISLSVSMVSLYS